MNKLKKFKIIIAFGSLVVVVYYIYLYSFSDLDLKLQSHYKCSSFELPLIYHNRSLLNTHIFKRFQGNKLYKYKNEESWIEVLPHFFIYSAYNDNCKFTKNLQPCIKIVAIVLKHLTLLKDYSPKPFCYVKTNENNIIKTGIISYTEIQESHERCYSAAFIDCPLYNTDHSVPQWITIGESLNRLKWIPVHQSDYNFDKKELAVCVRPLYGPFNYSISLLEFISYYNAAGVDHFYFYDQDIVPEISVLFKFIADEGKISVDLLLWNMTLDSELVHETGQLAHIQDCILRSRNNFKHVILVDLDEFIVPQYHNSLKEMLYSLDAEYSNAGSYVFPMVFFCDEFMFQESKSVLNFPFLTLNNFNRQKTPWYYHERSKTIINPAAVMIGGIHFMWKHFGNYKEVRISSNIALLHHYRTCCGMQQTWIFHLRSFYVLADKRLEDKTMMKYQEKMLNSILMKALYQLVL